ncbi:MAG: PilZ domain-containing protein [Verrucomicrobia bacterium]|nr:PilZ domain-containing protein [Verrucomicrobiota bacterium]
MVTHETTHNDARRFLRHATTITAKCRKEGHKDESYFELRNISFGGMAFVADCSFLPGDIVEVSFPVLQHNTPFRAEIVWCSRLSDRPDQFMNGVRFLDEDSFFHARLTEQMCHIEAYRQAQAEKGRQLTAEEAAFEWADRHAESFPRL